MYIYLLKYWYYIVILFLSFTILYSKFHYETKINVLKEDYLEEKLEISLRENQRYLLILEANKELQDRTNIHMVDLAREIQNINSLSLSNKSELNSLYKTIDTTSENYSKLTQSSAIEYTNTLSTLFKDCSGMVTDLAAKADEATSTAIIYHKLLKENKEIVDQYNDLNK